ncbi:MAG TPA: hypothetical protein PKE69_20855 [Pyrinomonadaceae bacterium]|nr:hypothetical protein [Pyrinomonadaceae bacterium]
MQNRKLSEIRERLDSPLWQEVPFMNKTDLRKRFYDVSENSEILHWFSSSGSTGEPVIYPWTKIDEEIAKETICKVHSEKTDSPGTALIIAPTGLPGMWYHMDNQLKQLNYATVFPGVDSVERIFDLIGKLQPTLLISLPLVLSRLGEFRLMNNASGFSSEGILFSGGDVLSKARKKRIEKFWGAKLKNFYGLSEVFGPLAKETEDETAFEWCADQVFVEIINPLTYRNVEEGETGIAVITTLWERPASLVRYWTGDCFKLIKWLDTGKPVFQMRGREKTTLPFLKSGYFPVDVDEILLGESDIGNEWAAFVSDGILTVKIETLSPDNEPEIGESLEQLKNMFENRVNIQFVPPGALDRKSPKLSV